MRQRDVTIVGGGFAGSLAAAMLSRAGHDVALVDPHEVYPFDFRCEKFDTVQVRILKQTGLSDIVLPHTTPDRGLWVARCGRVIERRAGGQVGFFYDAMINTVRGAIAPHASKIFSKATQISTSDDRQLVKLANGEEIVSRLVVLANGLNVGLRHKLGMDRMVQSTCHSITIGFNLAPIEQAAFQFPALTNYSEDPAQRAAYITLFPIGSEMRANLFVYRDMQDPWLRQFREAPPAMLFAAMPRLRNLLGDFKVTDQIRIRPVDLYVTTGHRQAGIALVGDAFASSCPATGLGARKVLTDVERLCNVHIPNWLATPGMSAAKIDAYYDDPVKMACDAHSASEAYALRSFTVDTGMRWRAERWAKFAVRGLAGTLRQMFHGAPQDAETSGTASGHSSDSLVRSPALK